MIEELFFLRKEHSWQQNVGARVSSPLYSAHRSDPLRRDATVYALVSACLSLKTELMFCAFAPDVR